MTFFKPESDHDPEDHLAFIAVKSSSAGMLIGAHPINTLAITEASINAEGIITGMSGVQRGEIDKLRESFTTAPFFDYVEEEELNISFCRTLVSIGFDLDSIPDVIFFSNYLTDRLVSDGVLTAGAGKGKVNATILGTIYLGVILKTEGDKASLGGEGSDYPPLLDFINKYLDIDGLDEDNTGGSGGTNAQ